MNLKNWSTFHTTWLLVSVLFSIYVVWQIEPQVFKLSAERIPFEKVLSGQCKANSTCTILGKTDSIDVSNISDQLKSFDNFFPLSVLSKLNIRVSTYLDSNLSFEVTYPKYSEKITDIQIYCGPEKTLKFDSHKPDSWIYAVREWAVVPEVANFYECEGADIRVSYQPKEKVEVGPNEYVKLVTNDNELPALLMSGSVAIEPNCFTKIMIFLIIFFLSVGAGSIFFPFYKNLKRD